MKISAVETTVVRMPMHIDGPAPKMGGVPRTSMDILLVRVDTDEGITGWGEAFGDRAGLPARQGPRDRGGQRQGRARRAGSGYSTHGGLQLPVGCRRGGTASPQLRALPPALDRGGHLASRGWTRDGGAPPHGWRSH